MKGRVDEVSARTWWTVAAAVAAVLVAPLFTVEIPPLLDYPNHLARRFVLARGAADPFLSRVYGQHWSVIPNIAIDLVMPPMLALMRLQVAGKIMLALMLLLPLAGTAAYSRVALRRRSLWPLGAGLVAYNFTFMLGFMNFLIGVGVALLAAAWWMHARETRPRSTVLGMAVLALLLFFVHIFAALLLGLLILCQELVAVARDGPIRRVWWRNAALRALAALAVFAVPIALYFASPLAEVDEPPFYVWRNVKAYWLFGPVLNYNDRLDIGTGVAILLVVLVCLVARRAVLSAPAALAGIVLLALYPWTPAVMKAVAYIDVRLPVMAAFLLFAGFAPSGWPRLAQRMLAIAAAALFVVRIGVLTQVWHGQTADLAAFRAVIAHVEPGSRVLVAVAEPEMNPGYWAAMPRHRTTPSITRTQEHLPALLLTERSAIWPLLFTVATTQPVFVRPAFRDVTQDSGMVADYTWLHWDTPPLRRIRDVAYLREWPSKYDYVLVMPAGGIADPAAIRPDKLRLVVRSDVAALLKVVH